MKLQKNKRQAAVRFGLHPPSRQAAGRARTVRPGSVVPPGPRHPQQRPPAQPACETHRCPRKKRSPNPWNRAQAPACPRVARRSGWRLSRPPRSREPQPCTGSADGCGSRCGHQRAPLRRSARTAGQPCCMARSAGRPAAIGGPTLVQPVYPPIAQTGSPANAIATGPPGSLAEPPVGPPGTPQGEWRHPGLAAGSARQPAAIARETVRDRATHTPRTPPSGPSTCLLHLTRLGNGCYAG